MEDYIELVTDTDGLDLWKDGLSFFAVTKEAWDGGEEGLSVDLRTFLVPKSQVIKPRTPRFLEDYKEGYYEVLYTEDIINIQEYNPKGSKYSLAVEEEE